MYALSLVSNLRDEMSHFLLLVSKQLVEECRSAIIHDNMNVSRLMVHAQQVEYRRLRRKNKESKKAMSYEGGSLKGKLDIQDKPRIDKMFSNQVPTKFPKDHDDRVSNPKYQKGRGTSSPSKKRTYGMCGKKHYGD